MLLTTYRVLDFSDERGQLAGQMLADMGADVVLVEPPGGSTSRRLGPFTDGHRGDPEHSMWFWSYNRGKRSVVLDLDTADGQAQAVELARGADIVIESADPGWMAERGLGPDHLAAVNPALVYTSISPFGQDGPKADWHATDLNVVGAGMQLMMMGDEDRPPVRVALDQSFLHASAEAAAATMVALYERNRSGRGQHIDVSAQQAIAQATQSAALCHLYNAPELTRCSGGVKMGPFKIRLRSPAADGYVSITILFGEAIGPFGKRLFEWIHEEGECDDGDLEIDWINFVEGVMTGRIGLGEYDRIQDVAAAFSAKRTKAELLQSALERRLLLVPIANVADVATAEQYEQRDFWVETDVAGVGEPVRFPGAFAKFSATPLDPSGPPPAIGAHTTEVLGADRAPAAMPASAPAAAQGGGALAGLKVLDFMWVMAGPAATRVLADNGATVVRVESANRIETARTIQPFLNDEGGPENSGLYQNMNAGKLGITLDMAKPEARDVVLDLVRWADVVCESFSPKAMRGWGLGYDDLRAVKPDIIMASSCLFGQSGPLSSLAGFGTMGASLSGFYEMTGWPDRDPAGVFGAYTDYISPRYLTSAILGAIDHRDRTGDGQHIDLSQAEASMAFLTPALLDYGVNGTIAERPGNRHPTMTPHGVFPVAGDDKWITLVCQDDQQWQALCREAGFGDELAALDTEARRAREDEIESMISAWTVERDGARLETALQAVGVAAHRAQNSADLVADEQLRHRGHFVEAVHDEHGTMWVEGSRFRLSRTPANVTSAGPTLGQHTFDVLQGILGYDDERLGEVAAAGVLE